MDGDGQMSEHELAKRAPLKISDYPDLASPKNRFAAFDEALDNFGSGKVGQAVDLLGENLHVVRQQLTMGGRARLKAERIDHPVAKILHQAPLTSWSYRKPPGYPDDAQFLDLIYRVEDSRRRRWNLHRVGREIYHPTRQAAARLHTPAIRSSSRRPRRGGRPLSTSRAGLTTSFPGILQRRLSNIAPAKPLQPGVLVLRRLQPLGLRYLHPVKPRSDCKCAGSRHHWDLGRRLTRRANAPSVWFSEEQVRFTFWSSSAARTNFKPD